MPHLDHAIILGSSRSVFLTLILLLTVLVYLTGWLSLRFGVLKGTSAWRAFSFLVGLFLIWAAVASPIALLDHELLTVHMLQHLLLMTVAPPLIWLGRPARTLLHGLPKRFVDRLVVPLVQSRAWRRVRKILGRPRVCWLAACATLIGWHIPTFFALGMQSVPWHLFEHLSFLATGLLFWWPVVPRSGAAPQQDLSMILYLFFATLPCDILSGFLVFSDRVFYPIYFSSSHLLGFSPLVDQQCAAALMWTCVTVVYLVAGAILTMRILSPQASPHVCLMQPRVRAAGISHRVSQSMVSQSLEVL
jgi:putative membrane protein